MAAAWEDDTTAQNQSDLNGHVPESNHANGDASTSSQTSNKGRRDIRRIPARHISHVSVFWPRDLLPRRRMAERSGSQQLNLVGWTLPGGPEELAVVVCAALTETQIGDIGILAREGGMPTPDLVELGSLSLSSDALLPSAKSRITSIPSIKGKERATLPHDVWISMSMSGDFGIPRVHCMSLGSVEGAIGPEPEVSISLCLFRPPNPTMLRFLSLEPLALAPTPVLSTEASAENYHLGQKLENLLAERTWRWFELTGGFPIEHQPGAGLRRAVEQMNATFQYRMLFDSRHKIKQGFSLPKQCMQAMGVTLSNTVTSVALALQICLAQPLLRGYSLCSISNTAAQLHLRLHQVSSFPMSAAELRRLRKDDNVPIRFLAARYITVWNGMWLIANDIILGWTFGETLIRASEVIAPRLAEAAQSLCLHLPRSGLRWLDDWPIGIKLNTQLSGFYKDMYTGLIDVFSALALDPLVSVEGPSGSRPTLISLLRVVGLMSRFLGLSILLCLVADLMQLLTLHLKILHRLARAQYSAILSILSFLLDLFRGKKQNVLLSFSASQSRQPQGMSGLPATTSYKRRTTTDAQYEMDQLLLGTILFTTLLFLLPTMLAYHLLFALLRIAVETFTQGIIIDLLVNKCINALPLFAVLLRIKDRDRLPGGIIVEKLNLSHDEEKYASGAGSLPVTYYNIKLKPLSFAHILTSSSSSLIEPKPTTQSTTGRSESDIKGPLQAQPGLVTSFLGMLKDVITGRREVLFVRKACQDSG